MGHALGPKLERHVDVLLGLPPQLAFHRGEDHHEMFVRAQMSRALHGDVEAWNERRQAQPIEDADAEIQDSHGTDSRRESPGPILDLGWWSRPRNLEPGPETRGSRRGAWALLPWPP